MNKYIQYAKVLKMIAVEKGNFKTILFREFKGDSKLKEAYGILIKATKNYDKIIEIGEIINERNGKDLIGNMQLFCILVIEQFFSRKKKIEGGGQLKKVVVENKEFIASQLDLSDANTEVFIKQDIHIRLISRSLDSLEQSLKSKKASIDLQQGALQKLPPILATGKKDEDIFNLYTLNYSNYQTAISKDSSVLESSEYVIQSKSSSLPVFILFTNLINNLPYNKFDIIDCCSAPGNKTIQAAEYLGQKGKVFAFEKDQQRFQLLKDRVAKFKFQKQIETTHSDFFQVDLANGFDSVLYCIADPSCSGTGMLSHIYFDEEQKALCQKASNSTQDFQERTKSIFNSYDNAMKQRIEALGQFQLRILNQLTNLPNLKGFSYSTCSIHRQENEDVVARFLQAHPEFELVTAAPSWNTRGFKTQELPQGDRCVRVSPFDGKSDGFFVALFKKKTEKFIEQSN